MMIGRYPLAQMSQFLRLRKEFFTIDDAASYQLVTVQLHARGIRERQQLTGAEIKTKRQQRIQAGDLLVAEIDAKVGGFGVVPAQLAGAIVSSHYFLYEIDASQADPRYLEYYLKSGRPEQDVQQFVKGSVNYAAIRPHHFPQLHIPLPPLDEQRRIVARIEALAGRIAEAQRLQDQSCEEGAALMLSALGRMRRNLLDGAHPKSRISDVTTVTAGGTPSRAVPLYWGGKIPWLKTGELVDGDIYQSEEHITEDGLRNSSAKLFPPNTVLIGLYGQGQTRGRTGRLLIEAATNQACCAILPTPSLLEARFTQYWLRSLYTELREMAHGGTQPNWNAQMIKDVEIVIPPLDEQRRIISSLDDLQIRTGALRRLQESTHAELAALLPAVLDKAFRGEL